MSRPKGNETGRRRESREDRKEIRREVRRESRRQRRRRRFLWPAIAIVVIAIAMLLFTDLFGFQLIPGLPQISFVERSEFASSTITLESVRSVSRFETVRYVHRAVFPYDYLPDGVSINTILRKLREATGTVRDALTADEYLYFTTWNLASDIGLRLSGGAFDFVVVTLEVSGGSSIAPVQEPLTVAEVVSEDGRVIRSALVQISPPEITRVIVEDINPEEYPYPDTALGADAWRRVTDFVRDRPLPPEVVSQVYEVADRNAREFIRSVLDAAGFDEIRFAVNDEPRALQTDS